MHDVDVAVSVGQSVRLLARAVGRVVVCHQHIRLGHRLADPRDETKESIYRQVISLPMAQETYVPPNPDQKSMIDAVSQPPLPLLLLPDALSLLLLLPQPARTTPAATRAAVRRRTWDRVCTQRPFEGDGSGRFTVAVGG